MAFLQKQAVRSRKKRNVYPFKRANGRSPARNPVQVGSPEDFASSVATQRQSLMASDWTKDSKTLVLALFRFTFVRTKVNPRVRGREGPAEKHPGPGGGTAPILYSTCHTARALTAAWRRIEPQRVPE